MKNKSYFTSFSNVNFTKGFSRSLVVDLFTGFRAFVPNALVELIENSKYKSMEEIKLLYSTQEYVYVEEYLKFLDKNKLIYFGTLEEVKCFESQGLDFSFPSNFIDSIVEVAYNSPFELTTAILKLEELNVRHVEIRFLDDSKIESHLQIIETFCSNSNFETFSILAPYSNKLFESFNEAIFTKVKSFVVYNAPIGFVSPNKSIIISAKKSIIAQDCGNVNEDLFIQNIEFFSQSKSCNTCLSHKVSINKEGQIVNCPASKKQFGLIENVTEKQLMSNVDFTSLWSITKDNVEICKDCEFRNICMDCRELRENDENIYSKPLKCNYDPYKNTWN